MSDLNVSSAQYCHQFAASTVNNATMMTALTNDRETPACATGIEVLFAGTVILTLLDGRTKTLTVPAGWARAIQFTAVQCDQAFIVYRSSGKGTH